MNMQVVNFLRFCELLVRKCPSLKEIQLTTSKETKSQQQAMVRN